MANVLIVHAHPEPMSFSSALAQTAREELSKAGHQVAFSDLYRMRFDPVSGRENFTTVAHPEYFKQQREEHHATLHQGFTSDLEQEMQKVEAADLLIFSFPLWWFGMPAILKGWIDRVFAFGRIYGAGRWYENGIGRGKRAMAMLTTGSPASAFGRNGLHASLESILTPIHHGVFWFNGYGSLRPFVSWAPAHVTEAERARDLHALRERLSNLFEELGAELAPVSEHEDGTWKDRHPRFVVTARRRTSSSNNASLPSADDLTILRRLRRSGRLLRAIFAPPYADLWQGILEMRVRTEAEALALVADLPLGRLCELECVSSDPAAEDSISPIWAPV